LFIAALASIALAWRLVTFRDSSNTLIQGVVHCEWRPVQQRGRLEGRVNYRGEQGSDINAGLMIRLSRVSRRL
jgi:hypothetical protein